MLPNIPQMIIAYYGVLKIGGVVVLPNPDADAPAIIGQLQQTGAALLVTLREFGALARAVQEQLSLAAVPEFGFLAAKDSP